MQLQRLASGHIVDMDAPYASVLTADGMALSYGDLKVLRGTYVRISTGAVTGLIGLNGVGKSTLLRMLLGAVRSDSCVIHIDGRYTPERRLHQYVSWLPQSSFLPLDLPLVRAAKLFAGQRGVEALEYDEACSCLLTRKVRHMSSGQRRYSEFLLTLALDRQFVLLDEPFAQVEPITVQRMTARIRESSRQGFLVTDQNMKVLLPVCDNLILLKDGRLVDIGMDESTLIKAGYLPPT